MDNGKDRAANSTGRPKAVWHNGRHKAFIGQKLECSTPTLPNDGEGQSASVNPNRVVTRKGSNRDLFCFGSPLVNKGTVEAARRDGRPKAAGTTAEPMMQLATRITQRAPVAK